MPTIARRTIAVAVAAVAIIAVAVALDLPSAQAEPPEETLAELWASAAAVRNRDEQAGRIIARRHNDGRTEFGWQPSSGARVLPTGRYFPANVGHQRWLNSSAVEVAGTVIGRISARQLADGRIEFALTPLNGERILPPARYFPAAPRPNRWLRSTEITISLPRDPFLAVSAGIFYTCALRFRSGAIECWGSNTYGVLDAPAGSFTAVSVGATHNCALRESGEIACWGNNEHGQTDAPAGNDFIAVSAGGDHTCAIRKGGEIECWGSNDRTVTTRWESEPHVYREGTRIVYGGQLDAATGRFSAVSAGGAHSCAIRTNGEIACWGDNAAGQTLAPTTSNHPFSIVSAGRSYTCAISVFQAIACWGDNSYGQTDAPDGSDYMAVSAGDEHTCAIRHTGGAIACWGDNFFGRTDAPAGTFYAVSVGGFHSCAIHESGEIACWGDNRYEQTDVPAP